MKSHESHISTNSSEGTCHVAFGLRDGLELLCLSAAFIFMGYCVRFVTKLKSQPEIFLRNTELGTDIAVLELVTEQSRAGVLLDQIGSSPNSKINSCTS